MPPCRRRIEAYFVYANGRSGLAGAATAYFMMEESSSLDEEERTSITMLDAREACHGATGNWTAHSSFLIA
jgi:glycine/D-amino acid oxidase-like deaminating enzyme